MRLACGSISTLNWHANRQLVISKAGKRLIRQKVARKKSPKVTLPGKLADCKGDIRDGAELFGQGTRRGAVPNKPRRHF